MPPSDTPSSVDLIVVGAGAAGMTAAVVAAAHGLDVLVIEKTGQVGGTTAISGGMVWIPCNGAMAAAGSPDDASAVQRYLEQTVPTDDAHDLRRAFLDAGPRAIDYLARHTAVALTPVEFYPDYYPNREGASTGRRVLEPVPFDASTLGEQFGLLRAPMPEFTLFGGMMIARQDIPHLRRATRSTSSFLRVSRLVGEYAAQRLRHPRGTRLVLGNALAGRLLKSLLDRHVPIRTRVGVRELIRKGDRVSGLVMDAPDGTHTIAARAGVVIATGGFSHDPVLRARYLPAEVSVHSPFAPGSTGDGLRLGTAAGGRIEDANADNAFWAPVSVYRRADGRTAVFPHTVTDRGKPGSIAVNAGGRRFTNEAVSYHEFVRAMLHRSEAGPAVPAWLVGDRRFLWRYGLGAIKPFTRRIEPFLAAGYLRRGATPRALAEAIGVDADPLEMTIATFNEGARHGVDAEFGRGEDTYSRYLGDAEVGPNPCLAPIETPPLYAVELMPSDLGTVAGLRTDADARVLGADDAPIPGLYAAGNDMRSIMCGHYPGPGITLGPALVFGYLAACHAARSIEG